MHQTTISLYARSRLHHTQYATTKVGNSMMSKVHRTRVHPIRAIFYLLFTQRLAVGSCAGGCPTSSQRHSKLQRISFLDLLHLTNELLCIPGRAHKTPIECAKTVVDDPHLAQPNAVGTTQAYIIYKVR